MAEYKSTADVLSHLERTINSVHVHRNFIVP